jgi:hypothetical protein
MFKYIYKDLHMNKVILNAYWALSAGRDQFAAI